MHCCPEKLWNTFWGGTITTFSVHSAAAHTLALVTKTSRQISGIGILHSMYSSLNHLHYIWYGSIVAYGLVVELHVVCFYLFLRLWSWALLPCFSLLLHISLNTGVTAQMEPQGQNKLDWKCFILEEILCSLIRDHYTFMSLVSLLPPALSSLLKWARPATALFA